MPRQYLTLAAFAVWLWTPLCRAQTAPSFSGPLQPPKPNLIGGEAIHDLSVNGVISGIGLAQSSAVASDESTQAALSNAQIFLQKTSGWWQFYVQAGAYNIPSLGLPFLSTEKTVGELFGPVPLAYLKLTPAKNTSVLIGALPSLMGAESIFSFQNMNVLRGLLWNQENNVNRGVQVNQTMGKLTASLSWNDGFYSNRYSWLGGALTYAAGPHSVSFQAMGNLGQTAFRSFATPVQNNSSMYALIYTYSKGPWIVQPYVQYTDVSTNPRAGLANGATTRGGALLLSHSFGRGFSLAGRGEYLASAGALDVLYGPGSAAWSATVTPTFQRSRFFARGDLALVRLRSDAPGVAFGRQGVNRTQFRAVVEAGVLF